MYGVEDLLTRVARSLSRQKIPYMIIGGQAVLLYGAPRLTRDIDITLGLDTDAIESVLGLAAKMGLRLLHEKAKQFALETKVLPTEDPASGFRIDFVFSSTPYERQAIQRAKRVRIKGTVVRFASLEDLIIHKMFAGRAVDLEDVKGLLIQNNKKIDLRYIRRWLRKFVKLPGKENCVATFDRILKRSLQFRSALTAVERKYDKTLKELSE